jgi:hypothetical protein
MESRIMTLSLSTMMSGGGAQSDNNFTVMTEGNGYTLVDLTTTYPAGRYAVASKLVDITYDIYLIAEDGSNAGYLAASSYIQLNINATKAFNKVVIYGATNNDVINFTYSNIYSATGPSTGEFTGAAPRLISISTSDLPNQNNTTTITGQNFATDVEVTFTGTDNIARSAKAINRVSSTSIVVTRPDDMPTTYSPYTITASNPGITPPTSSNLHKLVNSITAGNAPVWVTSATLPAYRKNEGYSQTIQATDADGGSSIIYSIVSGALPTGLSFNTSTGTFSGTPTTNTSSPYSYTIRATDAGANYVDRAFTIQQLAPDAPTSVSGTDVGTGRAYNNGAVSVAFTPAITGPSATSYTATAYLSGVATAFSSTGSSSPLVVTGLASNTGYTFVVTASNASGSSLLSTASPSVTATTVPQAPSVGTLTISGTTASVPVTANATGGKAITSYTVLSNIGGFTASSASSPVSVASLAFGNTYTFTATATNANGTSSSSSASNGVALTYPASDSDNFNRTTSLLLGNTSGSGQAWTTLRGTWYANGSQAQSDDATSTVAMASVGTTSSNVTVSADVTAGTGIAWYISSANSWWGAVPYYASSTASVCGASSALSLSNPPSASCCSGVTPICRYRWYSTIGCGTDYAWEEGYCGSPQYDNSSWCGAVMDQTRQYYSCSTTGNVTTYSTYIRAYNNAGVSSDNLVTSNTSSFNNINSMKAVSSSGSVVVSAYSGSGLSSQLGSSFTYNGYPVASFGIMKGSGGSQQGSVVDNFSVG